MTVKEKVYYLDIPLKYNGVTVAADVGYLVQEGQTVTLTIIPDEGSELESITIYKYGDAKVIIPITCTDKIYSFTMPAFHITFSAIFKTLITGIGDIPQANGLKAYVENGLLYVSGAPEGMSLCVYNMTGTLVYQGEKTLTWFEIQLGLPAHGVYIVTDGKRVLKIVY